MTTREHIKALEMQRDELKRRVAELELQPGQDLIRMKETIQHERQWRQRAEAELSNVRFVMDKRGDGIDELRAALKNLVDAVARTRKADDAVSRNSGFTADWDEHEDAHASLIICENEARALLPASPLTARSG